ncbi:MAG: insulinase family protein, partial [Planctomycetaceae bacterium]
MHRLDVFSLSAAKIERNEVAEKFYVKSLPNGMTVLGQVMEQVTSAAMTLVVPAGSSHDPSELAGAAAVASEWMLRGAGGKNTRQLNDALDSLGCQHHEKVQSEYIQCATAQLGSNLPAVLEIFADVILRPTLDDATFDPCRALIMQDLISLEDEPGQKCNMILREKFYPDPLGRSPYGTAETLEGLTAGKVRDNVKAHLNPHGAMLAVAGKFDWSEFCGLVEKYFGQWAAPKPEPVRLTKAMHGVTQIQKDSSQSHIAIAHKAANVDSADYYTARLAETILSGGMSGRLFTEVREKRGLVYHVSSR